MILKLIYTNVVYLFVVLGVLLLIRPAVIRNLSEYQLGRCSGFDAKLMKWTLKHQHASCRGMEAEQCLNVHTSLVYSIAPRFPSDGGSLLPLLSESAFAL